MKKKITISLCLGLLILFYYVFDLGRYFSLSFLQDNYSTIQSYYVSNKTIFSLSYFLIYILITAASLPGASILTLLAGAIFDLTYGVIIVSFASTIGATSAFLLSRYVFRESVEKKFFDTINKINRGLKKDGKSYLFILRLIPAFPFFIINLSMGLTRMKLLDFFWVSQLGMLPGTFLYVGAGEKLSSIKSLSDILTFDILWPFFLIGLFPMLAKFIIKQVKNYQIYRPYERPKSFDYNMVVIGAGSGGLVTSYISAAIKSRVALIEKNKMGGDCLNTGCVPSKALIKSSKVAHTLKSAHEFGVKSCGEVEVDFCAVMERVKRTIKKIEPHDSVERYEKLGVDCFIGEAKILSPWIVEVNGKRLSTKNITIGTGARPMIPSIKGVNQIDYVTSDTLWELDELPEKLCILGGGNIGLEMAQAFTRLGSKVTVVERSNKVLAKEDDDISDQVYGILSEEGVDFKLEHTVTSFTKKENKNCATLESRRGEVSEVQFDVVLFAIGRVPNTNISGLDDLGLNLRADKTLEVNEYLQTKYPNIYACGDVTGPYQLTHAASHQAWYCSVNAHFSPFKKFKVDYSLMPWVTYTSPEVARVGHNEKELNSLKLTYDTFEYNIQDLDRAITEGYKYGKVKVLTKKGSDKIYGVTIVSANAGEMIVEFVTAMKHKKGLNSILGTIHSYPTMSEANKYVAGNWKRVSTSELILKYLKLYHKLRR